MKKILLFAMLLAFTSVFPQQTKIDSLNRALDEQTKRVNAINSRINDIQINLTKSHKQYIEGLGWCLVGFIGTTLSGIYYNSSGSEPFAGGLMIGFSSILTITGTVMVIDSHRHIGLAGNQQ